MGFRIRLLSLLRMRRVRNRFLAVMILLTIPPFFILGFISFNMTKESMVKSSTSINQKLLETSSVTADLLFRNITSLNQSIVWNNQVRDLVKSGILDSNSDRQLISTQIQKIISKDYFNARFVNSVCVLDLKYNTYCIGRSDNLGKYAGSNPYVTIPKTLWYKTALEANGRTVYFGSNVLSDTVNTFSSVKLFRNSENVDGAPIGLLIFDISNQLFDSVFSKESKLGGYLVVDETLNDGHLVYASNENPPKLNATLTVSGVVKQLKKMGNVVIQYQNASTDLTFIHYVPKSELLESPNQIGVSTAIITIIIAFVAIIIAYLFSGKITSPISKLKSQLAEMTDTNSTDKDEVSQIGEAVQHVAVQNKQLNEKLIYSELKKREAELIALQAQIKPHFLYNTLDSIYWKAVLNKDDEIAKMAISLSESFKLSLNQGKELIPFHKELQHIEHYMNIQNIRYNNRFEFIAEVEPEIMDIEILKLIIQPLVENAIYHGLEPKVGEGYVKLVAKMNGEDLSILVEDNGVGFSDLSRVESGYGLRNVKERVLMFYGENAHFEVLSKQNEGTKIQIRFNPQRGMDQHV